MSQAGTAFPSFLSYSSPIHAKLPHNANSPNTPDLPSDSAAGDQSSRWSEQIAARYQCHLPTDLVDWFDSDIWKQTGRDEYCDPVHPQTLLDDAPEVIWPGLMPCDFLPLVGSRAGDWLGVKFDRNNQASEIIQWYHGGGDWIPWGKTISEAIVFGAVCNRLPGPRRRHAIPANDFRESTCDVVNNPLLNWAADHVSIDAQQLADTKFAGNDLANWLLDHNIAEVAVRCELVQAALAETLSEVLNHRTAQAIGIDWPTAVRWMFDNEQIPEAQQRRLESRHGYNAGPKQDWQLARQHAQAITESWPDIAWGWDLLGYCYEKAQQTDDAATAYRQGITKSVFSDQSVKLRTHWTAESGAKLSAARLQAIGPAHCRDIPADYLAALTLGAPSQPPGNPAQPSGNPAQPSGTPAQPLGIPAQTNGTQVQRRIAVKEYWLTVAEKCTNATDRFDAFMAAGWDLGAEPITAFADILSEVAKSNTAQTARTTLAATHRECMRQRYGI